MPAHRFSQQRRTHAQVQADERARRLAAFLGRSLKDAREKRGWPQRSASNLAGISQTCWSKLELGRGGSFSLRVWVRASNAVDADLRAFLERASAAGEPRDAVHLRHQEIVARTAQSGNWKPMPEHGLGGAGVADLLLGRLHELALVEVWDWFADVGDAFRSWDRKLERLTARGDEKVSGCWVVRATRRNRALINAHATLFTTRFTGRGTAWLAALQDPRRPMPDEPALLWVSVSGDRLFAARGSPLRHEDRHPPPP